MDLRFKQFFKNKFMKKILITLFIPTFGFIACQPTQVSQNIFNDCLAIPELGESNKCLAKIADDMIYYETYEKDIEVCQKMSKDLTYYKECFWLFAMDQRDSKICESLPEKSQKAKLEVELFSDTINYLTKSNCKNELNFESGDSQWNLIRGIPPIADPRRLYYKGNATIKGWIIKEPRYTEELISFFHISEDSLGKLPPSISYNKLSDFSLIYNNEPVSKEILQGLEKYSEKNPATIKIDSIEMIMEGAPAMNLIEIVNN